MEIYYQRLDAFHGAEHYSATQSENRLKLEKKSRKVDLDHVIHNLQTLKTKRFKFQRYWSQTNVLRSKERVWANFKRNP